MTVVIILSSLDQFMNKLWNHFQNKHDDVIIDIITIKLQTAKKIKFNLLPDDKILDWSKLTQIADVILKCI